VSQGRTGRETVRVGVIGPAREDDFAANIVAGLTALELSVVALGPVDTARGPNYRAAAKTLRRHARLGPLIEKHVVRRAQEHEVDIVITVESLRPETIRALRSNGSRVALWFPDAVANLGGLWMFDAPYNGLFFKEPALVRRLNDLLELPVHYLPEACNPLIHRPVESAEASGKVVVVGNLHPLRARLLERLLHDGIPLAIYGSPLHARLQGTLTHLHTGRYVRGLAKSAVFSSAAAVLNSLHPAEIEGMNCRLFEATAAGGAVVSEQRTELENLFQPGTEILAYESYGELLDSLRMLLEDPPLAQRLGRAASRRSLAEYTYARRLHALLERVA
jgi:spore maturation protein CgeB